MEFEKPLCQNNVKADFEDCSLQIYRSAGDKSMIHITSSSNPTIKEIKSLYRKKERWLQRSFIVEGIKIVEECIDKDHPLSCIVYCDQLFNIRGGDLLWEKIKDYDKLIKISNKLYKEISQLESPQGILAVAKFKLNSIDEIFDKTNPFILMLDQVQDPGNMGTIIRTADAFSVDGIVIAEGSVDVYNPKVVRSTMGSIFRVPLYFLDNLEGIIREFKKRNIKIYSTSLKGREFIQNINLREASAIIIGNESRGVSKPLEIMAGQLVKIPMSGEAESLNVAIASSIIMYEALRQRS